MKITMTHAELARLVRNQYSLPEATELEIADYSPVVRPIALTLVDRLTREGCLFANGNIMPDKKIASIKILRDMVIHEVGRCGLMEAKCAIEEWGRFLPYVNNNGISLTAMDTFAWRNS